MQCSIQTPQQPTIYLLMNISNHATFRAIVPINGLIDQIAYCSTLSHSASRLSPTNPFFIPLPSIPSGLLEMFMSRNNGQMPKQIIIYRDGVSDSQFNSVILKELPSIKGSVILSFPLFLFFCMFLLLSSIFLFFIPPHIRNVSPPISAKDLTPALRT